MPAAEPLQIRVLGGFEVTRGSDSDISISASAGRRLLAFLAIHRDRSHVRAHVAGTLWPGEPEPKALRKLSQALWRLRTSWEGAVQANLLHTTSTTLEIAPDAPLEIDLDAFERRLDDVARAFERDERVELAVVRGLIDRYRGGLLPGWYDSWLELPRERLRRRYLHALERARDAYFDEQAHGAALEIAERLVDVEPFHEAHLRSLLRILAWMDRRRTALRRYDAWTDRLRAELDVEPSDETQALAAELTRSVRSVPDLETTDAEPDIPLRDPRGVPFVARTDERRALVGVLDDIARGGVRVALVRGHPGVGKSRLLRTLRSDAAWRGIDVLSATGTEAARHEPYRLLRATLAPALQGMWLEQLLDLVDPVGLRELARVVPVLRTRVGRPRQDRDERVGEALGTLLLQWSEIRPVVVSWDDVQWADRASLDALRTALHQAPNGASRGRMGAVVAFRRDEAAERDEVRAWLDALDRDAAPVRIELEPLDRSGTLDLVVRALALGHRPEKFVSRLHSQTGGNPLFVVEALRSLLESGALYRDEAGVWHTHVDDVTENYAELPLTSELEATITRRLDRLEPLATATLQAAATFTDGVVPSVLIHAVDEDPKAVHAAIRSLVDRAFLTERDDRLAPAHDLVREVLERRASEDERRASHARSARTLDALGGAPEELGRHARDGGLPELAVASFRRAGEAARAASAFAAAAEHFKEAFRLAREAGCEEAERYAIGTELEHAYDILGRREEQGRLLDELADLVPAARGPASELATRRAWFHAHGGDLDRATELAKQALEHAWASEEDIRIADALHAVGAVLEMRGKSSAAREKLAAAAELAGAAGDSEREAHIRHLLATSYTGADRYERAPADFEAVLRLSRDAADAVLEARALNSLAAVRMESGDTGEADELYAEAVALGERIGHREILGLALANWGNLAYVRGDVRTALDRYDRASAVFDAAADRGRAAQVRVNSASVRSTILGEHDRAEEDLERALAYYEEVGDLAGRAHALDNLGIVAWHRDDTVEAERLLLEGRELVRRAEDPWMEAYNARSLALVQLERGTLESAEAAIESGLALTDELGLTDLGASLAAVRALVEAESGRTAQALERIDGVLERAGEGVQQRYLLHAWRARILDGGGHASEARAEIATAHDRLLGALERLSAEDRERSLKNVKPHRRIATAFAAQHPVERAVRLAAATAPLGRELDDHELVTVTWTVSHPHDAEEENRIDRRRRRLQRLVREAEEQGASPTVADLAAVLSVSASTIKRDLAALREAGHRIATRGHG